MVSRLIVMQAVAAVATVTILSNTASAIEQAKTEAGCSAFTAALVERSVSIARAVMTSNAYMQCTSRRLSSNYRACRGYDPYADQPLSQQIAKIYQALNNHNNLRYTCSYSTESNLAASSGYQGWGGYTDKIADLADDWMFSFRDWSWYRSPQPFNWRASTVIHEHLHAHNYAHPDDHAEGRAACVAQWGSYNGGTNSAPYIMGDCADNVIAESAEAGCDPFGAGPGAVNVVSSLREYAGGTRITCQTVYDPRHRGAFRTMTGNYLSPLNGGGAGVDAHGIGQGPWETVSVIPVGDAVLRSGGTVSIKTSTGHFFAVSASRLVANSTANFDAAPRFQITKVGAMDGTPIVLGDSVALLDPVTNRFVSVAGGGGGAVTVDRVRAAEWETFVYEEPRRANVVRLYTNTTGNRLYVNGTADVRSDDLDRRLPDRGEESSSFWLVDHNGGALESGDTVSIETLRSGKFLTVCASGSDLVPATADTMQACSKFVIQRIAGPGPIRNSDAVAFLTSGGQYLTSVAYEGGRLAHYTNVLGLWERFRVEAAQEARWPIQ